MRNMAGPLDGHRPYFLVVLVVVYFSERGADEAADECAENRETADRMVLVVHDHRRGRRRGRRMVHRRRLLMHLWLVRRAIAVAAVRRGKGCSAKSSADESRDQQFHDVVVHITPLSTFFFGCFAGDHPPLTLS